MLEVLPGNELLGKSVLELPGNSVLKLPDNGMSVDVYAVELWSELDEV